MVRKITIFSAAVVLSVAGYAQPRVWWHWMNGNITKEGIRKDLEWMHRAGIGGFLTGSSSALNKRGL